MGAQTTTSAAKAATPVTRVTTTARVQLQAVGTMMILMICFRIRMPLLSHSFYSQLFCFSFSLSFFSLFLFDPFSVFSDHLFLNFQFIEATLPMHPVFILSLCVFFFGPKPKRGWYCIWSHWTVNIYHRWKFPCKRERDLKQARWRRTRTTQTAVNTDAKLWFQTYIAHKKWEIYAIEDEEDEREDRGNRGERVDEPLKPFKRIKVERFLSKTLFRIYWKNKYCDNQTMIWLWCRRRIFQSLWRGLKLKLGTFKGSMHTRNASLTKICVPSRSRTQATRILSSPLKKRTLKSELSLFTCFFPRRRPCLRRMSSKQMTKFQSLYRFPQGWTKMCLDRLWIMNYVCQISCWTHFNYHQPIAYFFAGASFSSRLGKDMPGSLLNHEPGMTDFPSQNNYFLSIACLFLQVQKKQTQAPNPRPWILMIVTTKSNPSTCQLLQRTMMQHQKNMILNHLTVLVF